jgi:cation diffusion facilitator CzcD-associated flavoprotein CzcO
MSRSRPQPASTDVAAVPHVIVIGGGFGGVSARTLRKLTLEYQR